MIVIDILQSFLKMVASFVMRVFLNFKRCCMGQSILRYLVFVGVVVVTVISLFLSVFVGGLWFVAVLIFGSLTALGISDLM